MAFAVSAGDFTLREFHPRASERLIERAWGAVPIFDGVLRCVRIGPGNLNGINVSGPRKFNDDPLRVRRVRFAGEAAAEVRVALPVRRRIAIGNARVLILARVTACGSAVSDAIPIRVRELLCGLGAADKISILVRSIAPCAVWIPVPCVVGELGVLAVGYGAPAGREPSFLDGLREDSVHVSGHKDVHGGSHGFVGIEGDGLLRCGIDMHSLRWDGNGKQREKKARNEDESA